jgi:GNAT superfamily N-acetyltransferase
VLENSPSDRTSFRGQDHTSPPTTPLSARIALAAGASRGAGRGFAVELGAAGATFIVTGRSTQRRLKDRQAAPMKPARCDLRPTIVRDAAFGDIDELASTWFEGWNEAHAQIVPPELARFRTLSDLRARLDGSLTNTSVAVSDGRPVGFAMVKKDEMDQLYVARDARGSGVADALLSHALDRVRRPGHRRAWLACAIANHRAARFYRKSVRARLRRSADGPDGSGQKYDRRRLEQTHVAPLTGRDLSERVERQMRWLLHLGERHQALGTGLPHFLKCPSHPLVTG